MLDLHKRLQTAKTDHDRTVLERQTTATEQQIDQLVHNRTALCSLWDEAIAIVEGDASPGCAMVVL